MQIGSEIPEVVFLRNTRRDEIGSGGFVVRDLHPLFVIVLVIGAVFDILRANMLHPGTLPRLVKGLVFNGAHERGKQVILKFWVRSIP